jgi:hypothetical protein
MKFLFVAKRLDGTVKLTQINVLEQLSYLYAEAGATAKAEVARQEAQALRKSPSQ